LYCLILNLFFSVFQDLFFPVFQNKSADCSADIHKDRLSHLMGTFTKYVQDLQPVVIRDPRKVCLVEDKCRIQAAPGRQSIERAAIEDVFQLGLHRFRREAFQIAARRLTQGFPPQVIDSILG
jgi:hypothetical protein